MHTKYYLRSTIYIFTVHFFNPNFAGYFLQVYIDITHFGLPGMLCAKKTLTKC
jgi:hypothetical protein